MKRNLAIYGALIITAIVVVSVLAIMFARNQSLSTVPSPMFTVTGKLITTTSVNGAYPVVS